MDRTLRAKNMKIFVSHVNVYQRVTSAEEDFNNKVERITCSIDTTQLLPQPLLSSSNGLMDQIAMVAGMEVMHRLSSMNFHLPRLIWLQLLPSAQSISSRD